MFAHATSGRFFLERVHEAPLAELPHCLRRVHLRGSATPRCGGQPGEREGDGRARGFRSIEKNPHCAARAIGGARARTSTTSALATVSSWDSLDRRSPRRSDRSPPCSFRFSRCARGRWGRGRERTRQCDPRGHARLRVSTEVCGNTSCAFARCARGAIRSAAHSTARWVPPTRMRVDADARRGRRSMGRTWRVNRTVTEPTGSTGVPASPNIVFSQPRRHAPAPGQCSEPRRVCDREDGGREVAALLTPGSVCCSAVGSINPVASRVGAQQRERDDTTRLTVLRDDTTRLTVLSVSFHASSRNFSN